LDPLAERVGESILPNTAAGGTLELHIDSEVTVRDRLPDVDELSVDSDNLSSAIQQDCETDWIVRGSRSVADVLDAGVLAQSQAALLTDDGVMAGGGE
jgi:hypothetical protein